MNTRKMLLGARIKEVRRRVGLSQDQLAEKVGIESKYLSRIEVGKRQPSLETLGLIADSLHVEMKELFDYSHHDNESTSPKGIEKALEGASKEELRLVYKLIKAVRQ
ncbi:MAG: helix-turn-helix transcriptional regulator [Candidatus Cloacimonetes bacterium]|nr:helix-turn-helix transcriptional regulator [Candidatus Cloacimonadota bacterium]